LIYQPSRLSRRIARRLAAECGLQLAVDPVNHCLNVCRETIAYNHKAGLDYNQWTLYEYDWSPFLSHGPAVIIEDGRRVVVEIGAVMPATEVVRWPRWSLEREWNVFRIRRGPSPKTGFEYNGQCDLCITDDEASTND
jgi:hypothetical protein